MNQRQQIDANSDELMTMNQINAPGSDCCSTEELGVERHQGGPMKWEAHSMPHEL